MRAVTSACRASHGAGVCLLQPPQDAGSSEQVQLGRDCLLRGFCIVSRG